MGAAGGRVGLHRVREGEAWEDWVRAPVVGSFVLKAMVEPLGTHRRAFGPILVPAGSREAVLGRKASLRWWLNRLAGFQSPWGR